MSQSVHKGFTLIELIMTIVIIGVLSAVAIPKFSHLIDNSKISSEQATASSIQSALEAVHGDWITSSCPFTWGNAQSSTTLNSNGYPSTLGTDNNHPFNLLLKNADNGDWVKGSDGYYRGPATNGGAKDRNLANKPEGNDYWEYNATNGTFLLHEQN